MEFEAFFFSLQKNIGGNRTVDPLAMAMVAMAMAYLGACAEILYTYIIWIWKALSK